MINIGRLYEVFGSTKLYRPFLLYVQCVFVWRLNYSLVQSKLSHSRSIYLKNSVYVRYVRLLVGQQNKSTVFIRKYYHFFVKIFEYLKELIIFTFFWIVLNFSEKDVQLVNCRLYKTTNRYISKHFQLQIGGPFWRQIP